MLHSLLCVSFSHCSKRIHLYFNRSNYAVNINKHHADRNKMFTLRWSSRGAVSVNAVQAMFMFFSQQNKSLSGNQYRNNKSIKI
jgi:hypothetical protein